MLNSVVRFVTRLLADQRIRYLIVGGINTLVGFVLFAVFEITIGRYLGEFGYLASLVLSYAIAIIIAFALHRTFVFKVRGKLWLDFGRFVLSNMVGLGLNALGLTVIVQTFRIEPIIAQAMTAFLVAISSYLMHKHFSFRRTADKPAAELPTGEVMAESSVVNSQSDQQGFNSHIPAP